jgi:plasmid stabilization system protein ParE
MTRRLRVSQQAERDADDIYLWLAARSPAGALRWYEKYLSVLRELPQAKISHAAAPEANDLGMDLRQKLFQTRRGHVYRLLFQIREDTVDVLAVRGTGQDFLSPDELGFPG